MATPGSGGMQRVLGGYLRWKYRREENRAQGLEMVKNTRQTGTRGGSAFLGLQALGLITQDPSYDRKRRSCIVTHKKIIAPPSRRRQRRRGRCGGRRATLHLSGDALARLEFSRRHKYAATWHLDALLSFWARLPSSSPTLTSTRHAAARSQLKCATSLSA